MKLLRNWIQYMLFFFFAHLYRPWLCLFCVCFYQQHCQVHKLRLVQLKMFKSQLVQNIIQLNLSPLEYSSDRTSDTVWPLVLMHQSFVNTAPMGLGIAGTWRGLNAMHVHNGQRKDFHSRNVCFSWQKKCMCRNQTCDYRIGVFT